MGTMKQDGRAEFVTPEQFDQDQAPRLESNRGRLLFASLRSGGYLAERVVEKYRQHQAEAGSNKDIPFLKDIDKQFSDSETCVRLQQHVGGYDVFVFQALYDPTSTRSVDENYMALLIAARTLREHGANHITAVLPYLAYARQDKPTTFMREPTTARLMADLSVASGIDRLIAWTPHSPQLRGFYGNIPVTMLEGLSYFVSEFERFKGREDVIAVAPDVGASKLITHFGRTLQINSAIASKHRPAPEKVEISEIIGNFQGKKIAIVLDDMVSSAGTVFSLIRKLADEKGIEAIYLGVSHNLCSGRAYPRLMEAHEQFNLREMVVTNSIPQTAPYKELPFFTVHCLSDSLSRAINRIHFNRSVSEVFFRPRDE